MYSDQILWWKLSDHRPQGMVEIDFTIPIRDQDQCVGPGDPPTEVFDGVQGRLVGPMSVLDHENRRPR